MKNRFIEKNLFHIVIPGIVKIIKYISQDMDII